MSVGDGLLESFARRMQPTTAGDGVSRPATLWRCRLQPIPGAFAPRRTMTTQILQLSDLHAFADPVERLFDIPTRELLEDVLASCRSPASVPTTSS